MVRKKRSLGYGFADEVAKVSSKLGYFKKKEQLEWKDVLLPLSETNTYFDPNFSSQFIKNPWIVTFFYALCLVLFFIIFVRLFHLQIVEGGKNRELADGNRIQIKLIHAPRGVIFDRNGKVLAANSPAFRLMSKDIKKARLISREEALELEVKNDPALPDLEVDNVRTYPMGEKLAHVIGYVSEISESQLKDEKYNTYRLGDRIGISGIEAQYEELLKGKDGGEIIEVDSAGKILRSLRRNSPVPGQNLYLTIEYL